MNPILTLIIGIVGSSIVTIIAGFLIRKKTAAETSHLDADSADVLSQAAARLIPLYDSWVKAMEVRLAAAEEAAKLALNREAACLVRINELQIQINDLRRQIDQPQVTTLTATTTTVHSPLDAVEE